MVFRWEVFNVFNWANFANPAERCLESEHVREDQRDERESSHHAIRVEARVLMV